jgi:glycerophosphoryl diester phosphodiesterase
VAPRPFPDDAFPLVVAHRGASSTHPENTLPALDAAIELGAPIVEFDVRLSADGHAVVMHDADVSRTTDGAGLVHELPLVELRGLNAGAPDQPTPVPLLDEVLEIVSGRAGVAIEIKNLPGDPAYDPDAEATVDASLDALERTAFDGPVLFVSFNPRSIAHARRARTDIATGFLVTDAVPPEDALAFAIGEGHGFVLPGSRGLIANGLGVVGVAHEAGVRLGTWTVDDEPTFVRLLDAGLDAVATNDPAMGLRALARAHRPAGA